jgi:lambda family phage portal protein
MGTEITVLEPMAIGGGLEGAERTSRETFSWSPSRLSPDQAINLVKPEADARSRDMVLNDGYSAGAVQLHRDSIVGAQYRLNARPDHRVLGATPEWAEEFSVAAETRFNLAAESEECYFDAAGVLTFTGMVRLLVGAYVYSGEILATAEWIKDGRPFNTAIQMVSPDRLSNPDGVMDDRYLRGGVRKNARGRPIGYYIRNGHPQEWYDLRSMSWKFIPVATKWGRKQVLHIHEPMQIDQTRGVAEMVAALKHARMTKKFSEITLQNAVINASYAAAIESELPSAEIITAMGGGQEGYENAVANYLTMLNQYLGAGENVHIDGAKIPHFFPGTKLNLQPMGQPGGIGSDFEASLLRRISATLGVSYEELSRDLSKTNYTGLKAGMAITGRFMVARKTLVADRFARSVYALWVEEEIAAGNLPLPPGRNRTDFYRPMAKDAYTRCQFVGSGRGQIDELKETQAAMLRIKAGLSTYEIECSRLGVDFREIFEQRAREEKLIAQYGLPISLEAKQSKAEGSDSKATLGSDKPASQPAEEEDDDEDTGDE